MTEEFINIVKKEYNNWMKKEIRRITIENQQISEEIEKWKKIHTLLEDKKVRDIARHLGYKEKDLLSYLSLEITLYDFLRKYMATINWPEDILKQDKYPIFCYIKSETPTYSVVTGKKMSGFDDLYWNLQRPGYSFGPSDSTINGYNREEFKIKNRNNIIYPRDGESFEDLDTFYRVQQEFVEETLKTNQENAKILILGKYKID